MWNNFRIVKDEKNGTTRLLLGLCFQKTRRSGLAVLVGINCNDNKKKARLHFVAPQTNSSFQMLWNTWTDFHPIMIKSSPHSRRSLPHTQENAICYTSGHDIWHFGLTIRVKLYWYMVLSIYFKGLSWAPNALEIR